MPELPEVETWRRLADRVAVGQTILKAEAAADTKVFDRNPPQDVAKALKGQTILRTHRRGKHCWLELSGGQDLYLHFGMTGSLRHLQPGEAVPSHLKLELLLADQTRLTYRNMRRIGKVRLLPDAAAVPPVSALGPDPLEETFSLPELQKQLQKRKAPIKAVLLDQKVFAGVGNWIADEATYSSKISPHRRCNTLSKKEIEFLHRSLMQILETAVSVDADSSRFPEDWLFHYRWGKKAKTDSKGNPIRFTTIGGRTTAWVPSIQT